MTYEEACNYGRQAGKAINEHDQALYNSLRDWFRRAIAFEEHKVELQTMWNGGYKEVRDDHLRFRNLSARR